jgi:hypothetical protein
VRLHYFALEDLLQRGVVLFTWVFDVRRCIDANLHYTTCRGAGCIKIDVFYLQDVLREVQNIMTIGDPNAAVCTNAVGSGHPNVEVLFDQVDVHYRWGIV